MIDVKLDIKKKDMAQLQPVEASEDDITKLQKSISKR